MTPRRPSLLLVAGLLVSACGQRYELPPMPEAGDIPTPGSYNLDKVWSIPSPTDLVLRGSYLYVIEERSRVTTYLSRQENAVHPTAIAAFEGLVTPIQICLAQGDSTFVLVADAADMQIKRFYFRGGPPLSSFTDPAWVEISGLSADPELSVYVADAVRDTIYKYDRFGRRMRLVSDHGTGRGFVIEPHGLAYHGGVLWVADTGNGLLQRLLPDSTNAAYPGAAIGEEIDLPRPTDVATDLRGEHVFVVESENDVVFRFPRDGGAPDTVYSPARRETRVEPPIDAPRYLAADDSLVFLPDSANGRIVVLRLAQP